MAKAMMATIHTTPAVPTLPSRKRKSSMKLRITEDPSVTRRSSRHLTHHYEFYLKYTYIEKFR